MADSFGQDTNEKIEVLCRKISVAHNLDAEIQEELRSHMEDKLLGYLNGEEAVDEADAFILVREHFGDASSLKGLLQDVHAFEAQVSLARRLAAAIIVTTGFFIGYRLLVGAALPFSPLLQTAEGFYTLFVLMLFALPWLLLRHWQSRLDAGHKPWFLTWSLAYLAGAIAVLFILQLVVSMMGLFDNAKGIQAPSAGSLMAPLLIASPIFLCMIWLWWCDRPPRKIWALVSTAAVWGLWTWTISIVSNIEIVFDAAFSPDAEIQRRMTTVLVQQLFNILIYASIAFAIYEVTRRAAAGVRAHSRGDWI